MTLNRVVVTGYGLTSPIGNTPEEFWNNLHDGKIGIGPITKFDNSEIKVHNAGEIHDFPFDKYFGLGVNPFAYFPYAFAISFFVGFISLSFSNFNFNLYK